MSRRRMMLATIQKAAPVSVFFRSSSTISQTTFLSVSPNGAVHNAINEVVPDDDTRYVLNPGTTGTFVTNMTGPMVTAPSGAILRFRIRRRSGTGGRIRVYLENVLYGDQSCTGDWVTYEVMLTQAQAAALPHAAGIELKVTFSGFANSNQGFLTWAELEFN